MRNPALEAAIAGDPDDPEAYSVYADWLIGKGDPLGEHIAHALRLADSPSKKLAAAHAQHFAAHRDYLAGELMDDPQTPANGWRLGFVREAHIETADDLEILLSAPVGRFVTSLSLFDHSVVQRLRTFKAKPPLRMLAIAAPPPKRAKLDWLWKAFPRLERLEITGPVTLGTVAMPSAIEVILREADRKAIAAIDAATWPALEILDLSLGMFVPPSLPRLLKQAISLRELTFTAQFAPDDALSKLVDALLKGKVLANLRALELSAWNWKIEGKLAETIADNAARFAHLEVFDIDVGRKTPTAKLKLLRKLVKKSPRFPGTRTLVLS